MPKVSRTIVWSIVAGITGIAVLWLTQPQTPTTTTHIRASHSAAAAGSTDGITQADLHAHFPRYTGTSRNPFAPLVAEATLPNGSSPSGFTIAGQGGAQSGWSLTGIDTVNGVTSALVENGKTGESVFLHPGQHWQGFRVAALESNAVILTDPAGQQTRLAFITTVPDSQKPTPGPTASTTAPGAASTPSMDSISPLPPMPFSSNGRRGRRRGYDPTAGATESFGQ
jgi:hypothetical protein